jgi:hypothetical protein
MEHAKYGGDLRLPCTESTRLLGAASSAPTRQPSSQTEKPRSKSPLPEGQGWGPFSEISRTEPVRACGAICWEHRGNLRLSYLCGLFCLLLWTAACGAHQDGGTPPSPQQHLQDIMNNPHVPQGIKEAAQRQAQGQQGGGVQAPPRAGTGK